MNVTAKIFNRVPNFMKIREWVLTLARPKAEESILRGIATHKKYLMTLMGIYTDINEPVQV
jgi:hypothetical protein